MYLDYSDETAIIIEIIVAVGIGVIIKIVHKQRPRCSLPTFLTLHCYFTALGVVTAFHDSSLLLKKAVAARRVVQARTSLLHRKA